MATISSTGLGSGLNVESIVTQLMALEKRPLNLLQNAKSTLESKLSAMGQLTSHTSAMRDAANALSSVLTWKQTAATSSDGAAVGVASTTGAAIGSYAVSVSRLASTQTVTSPRLESAKSPVGTGTLTIELGRWDETADPPTLAGRSSKDIVITESDNTLEKIRDKINAAKAGVNATIVTDSQGSRLAIRSAETGAANAFRITAAETAGDGASGPGLSMLAFTNPADRQAPTQRSQTAADSLATLNGIEVTSATNRLENVADGITLTLNKKTTTDVEIAVTADDEAVTKAVETFVKAFNQLAAYVSEQTKYDPAAKTGGTLQGDRTTVSLLSQLRGVVNEGSTASSVYSRLSDVGISMDAKGLLMVDDKKLKSALSGNREELRKVFATDGATTGASGFMDRFRDLGNSVLGTDGLLKTRSSGLEAQIQQNGKRQEAFDLRLAATEARIRRQYQALDASMSSMSALSSYVSQQMDSLSNWNRKR